MPPRTRLIAPTIESQAEVAPTVTPRRGPRYEAAYAEGYDAGIEAGAAEADAAGYDRGKREGDETGYAEGYDAGYAAAGAELTAEDAQTGGSSTGAAGSGPVAATYDAQPDPTTPAAKEGGLHGALHLAGNMGRAGLAEIVGTAILVYTGTATAGAAALGKTIAGGPPNSLAVALAFGLVLAALVGSLGPISGAHLNPAVTLGLAVTRKFPWAYVPAYLIAQLAGAILGALATWATLGNPGRDQAHLGATYPTSGVSDIRAVVVEALITFLLVFVIIAVATDRRVPPAVASTSIGFALVAAVLIGGAITGGAVNPVRALGPMIVALKFTSFWVYLIGPIAGGIAAAVLYELVVAKGAAPTMPRQSATGNSD